MALIGFGDIGRNNAKRLLVADMRIIAEGPLADPTSVAAPVQLASCPNASTRWITLWSTAP